MKKRFILLAVAALSVSNMFAFTNIVGGGIKGSVPEFISSVNNDPNKQMVLNSTGIDLMYIGVFNSGISVKESVNIGFGSVNDYYLNSFSSPMISPVNFAVSDLLGIGYGFIRTEKLYVGTFFNIGGEYNGSGAFDTQNYLGMGTCLLLVGGDITAVFTPGRMISLFASVSANVGFGMCGNISVRTGYRDWYPEDFSWDVRMVRPTLVMIPTIGIAFRF